MPSKQTVNTRKAPQAIGPYSQAVRVKCDELVFCSGQIPLDPATGELVPGDIRVQAERVMENLKAVLDGAGLVFAQVVKTTIFLTDLNDFSAVNEVYGRYFPEDPPARATVEVAALPKGARVEIELVAAR